MSDNPHPHDPEGKGYHGPAPVEDVPPTPADEEAARLAFERLLDREREPENRSAVTHPSNAAPGHPALTNVGTIYDSKEPA